jgi:ribokinase
MQQRPIFVVGSLNVDLVTHVSRLPQPGETVLGTGSLKLGPGGKGANQAVAMARLGASVSLAGRIGNDPFGKLLLSGLHAAAVEIQLVEVDETETSGTAPIFLTPDGENAIVVAPGANMTLGSDQAHMARIFARIPQVRALVLQLEIPLETVTLLISAAYSATVPVILNLAPAHPLPPELLRKVTVFIANESEASLLSGLMVKTVEDAHTVALRLHQQGIRIVIVTLGEQGAVLVAEDEHGQLSTRYQPAPKVPVRDTTGAGDCFVGAFTVAWTEGQSLTDALHFAVSASALHVTRFGTQSAFPLRSELEHFFPQT